MKTRITLPSGPNYAIASKQTVKGLLIITMTFILFACFELSATAQVHPAATLSKDGVVQIPQDKPLASHYEFDLSKIEFSSDEEMIEFISNRSGSDYFVRANTDAKKAILVLDMSQHPNWTREQWHQHIQLKTQEKSFKK